MLTELHGIDLVEDFAREAVGRVFRTMTSIEVSPAEASPLPSDAKGQLASSVAFSGKITGVIYLCATGSFARTLASRILSMPERDVDALEMVNDTLGELTNMVVGRVKSQLCDQGLECTLGIPSIIRGPTIQVQHPSHVAHRALGFNAGNNSILIEIFLKQYES